MPMDIFQQFIYFTMVAAIYLSPILIILIIVFFIKKKYKAIFLSILSIPVIGMTIWGWFYWSLFSEVEKKDNEREVLAQRFDLGAAIKIYQGAFVGLDERGTKPYRRIFEFGSVDKKDQESTFIFSVPSERVHSAAFANFRNETSPKLEDAYLILINKKHHEIFSADENPEKYISTNFPSIPESVSIHNIFIMTMDLNSATHSHLIWSPKWRHEDVRYGYKKNGEKYILLWTTQKVYFSFLKGNREYI